VDGAKSGVLYGGLDVGNVGLGLRERKREEVKGEEKGRSEGRETRNWMKYRRIAINTMNTMSTMNNELKLRRPVYLLSTSLRVIVDSLYVCSGVRIWVCDG
jgi:hypothetical protein